MRDPRPIFTRPFGDRQIPPPDPTVDAFVRFSESIGAAIAKYRAEVKEQLIPHAWNSEFGVCACGFKCDFVEEWAQHVAERL